MAEVLVQYTTTSRSCSKFAAEVAMTRLATVPTTSKGLASATVVTCSWLSQIFTPQMVG
ncbi:MAG: hypothetical protein GY696_28480 [Gammaproteobacteria bacterium]|nr:hypothetical protein [Gammaproteobacteria bacterium]